MLRGTFFPPRALCPDITFEAAITKMMYLFGMNLSPAEVTTYLRLPLAGEMSVHV